MNLIRSCREPNSCRISVADWCRAQRADELAARIQAYWALRGGKVEVRLETVRTPNKKFDMWCVRSNMVNGMPR